MAKTQRIQGNLEESNDNTTTVNISATNMDTVSGTTIPANQNNNITNTDIKVFRKCTSWIRKVKLRLKLVNGVLGQHRLNVQEPVVVAYLGRRGIVMTEGPTDLMRVLEPLVGSFPAILT